MNSKSAKESALKCFISIGIIILIVYGFLTLQKPQTYDTEILTSGGFQEVYFDDLYKVYLADENIGTVDIRFVEQGLNKWVVHANFKKEGNTKVILEAPNGEKTVLDIKVKRRTYAINKKQCQWGWFFWAHIQFKRK